MKGILFKPAMIQAIIEGRKTQTRRAEAGLKIMNQVPDVWRIGSSHILGSFQHKSGLCTLVKPRYRVGETVYVKEAWSEWIGTSDHLKNGVISIEEAQADVIYKSDISDWAKLLENNGNPWLIKSTLHMPEWAARYFITITDVRAERLQEITPSDCRAEGITNSELRKRGNFSQKDWDSLYIGKFSYLWNSINKDYPWELNPWDFAYTFKQEMIRRR